MDFYLAHSSRYFSVHAVTDDTGCLVERYCYGAFGRVSLSSHWKRKMNPGETEPTESLINKDNMGVWYDSLQYGNGYGGFSLNTMRYLDTNGLKITKSSITSDEALKHYENGTGEDISIPYSEIDTSKVRVTMFKELVELINKYKCKKKTINIGRDEGFRGLYSVPGDYSTILGQITIKIWGTFKSDGNNWIFKGKHLPFWDQYDFNSGGDRGLIGEAMTQFGNWWYEGTEYHIRFRGAKKIKAEGKCCDRDLEYEKGTNDSYYYGNSYY